jgi:hypothetical protein
MDQEQEAGGSAMSEFAKEIIGAGLMLAGFLMVLFLAIVGLEAVVKDWQKRR